MNAPLRLRLRPSLLLGCAACALGGWSGEAGAQAFQASPTTIFGNVTYNRATPGVETVTVNSPTAVINWANPSPTNPFVFLPAGNVATFQNGAGNPDFVALNRILVGVPVRFDGRVVSQLVSASGTRPGGTLLFSTPGGIIVGNSAVFDVGNLVLTTLNVNVDGVGNFYDPATRGFIFSPPAGVPAGTVVTEAGAQINAPSANSYVAFVAPAIDHAGSVRVNGAAAYVAGNQVELHANDGLFDIIVPVGTDVATPITHSGTTGGPASTGAADIHRIYMVAVPRSQAITLMLGGNIGFDGALSASVENGAIILSAGYNVAGGSVDASAPVNPDLPASLSIRGGTISSRLTGTAVTNASASGGGGTLHATQDLTLVGGQSATLSAGAGEVVTMDRNVTLISPGGSAAIRASAGGRVSITGNVLLDATGTGFSPPKTGDAGIGYGGQASIYADGGAVAISGNATLRALGIGGNAASGGYFGAGGAGYGGEALVEGTNGGTVSIGGNLSADASGVGGNTSGYNAAHVFVNGATGQGGDVVVIGAGDGSVTVTGSSTLSANGTGGRSILTTGGQGRGDDILIQTSAGNVTLTGPVAISAAGRGGDGLGGGDATGGELRIAAFDGAVRIGGATTAALGGTGGAASGGSAGGAGTGGTLTISGDANSGTIDIASLDGHADGTGGASPRGAAGAGRGGAVDILTGTDLTVVGARPGIHFGALAATANGTGGAASGPAATPGSGTGGAIELSASQAPIRIDGATNLAASGTGGAAPTGASAGAQGLGGGITILADRASIALGTATVLRADGAGGDGNSGGTGTGGELDVEATSGSIDLGGTDAISASGTGGAARAGRGGDGTGGSVLVAARSGAAAAQVSGGAVTIAASGSGGGGAGAAGRGGDGSGGSVDVIAEATSGNLQLGVLTARANGLGGAGGGQGGAGTGGNVTAGTDEGPAPACGTPAACAAATQGSARFASVDLAASGTGGAGNGAAGGAGRGGSASLLSRTGPVAVAGTANLAADGTGGAGITRGRASGGGVTIAASANATTGVAGALSTGALTASASAIGDGGAGNPAGGWHVRASGGSTVTLASANVAASSTGPSTTSAGSTIEPNGGRITVTGSGRFSTASSLDVQATGTGSLTGGSITLIGDRVNFSHNGRSASGATVDVASLIVNAATDFVAGAGSLSRGSASADITAGGTARIAGQLSAPTIIVRSAEIDLPAGGFLGGPGTNQTTLQVLPAIGRTQPNQVVLGGAAQGPGYTLTAAEAARIGTGTLSLVVPVTGSGASRPPDLLVRDLSLSATGTTGFVGNLNLVIGNATAGIAEIAGNLALTGAGATNGIAIQAGDRVQIVTPTGSVRVRDAAGFPAGNLTFAAANIWSASRSLLDRLLADPDFAGRDAALLVNDGPDQPRGYIEGAEVTLRAGSTLLVQNSGTPTSYAGITVVRGTLTIVPAGPGPLDAYAFGNRINADGSFVTNIPFFSEVRFNPNGPVNLATFTPKAAFNTCIIVTRECGGVPPVPGRQPIVGPFVPVPLTAPDQDPVDASFATEPLIDEPVTSGGEPSIWGPPCDPRQDRQCPRRQP